MKIQLSDHFTYQKLLRFVFPTIIMMIFTSIYGVIDGLFVSNFVGKTPFAALNLVMPFVMILGGMGFMIGTGGSALVAMELGCGKKKRANQTFTMLILFTIILGLFLSIGGMLVIRPVSLFLGATPSMLPDCVLYGRITIAFTGAIMLQNVFQSLLAAAEKPKLGLAITIIAGVTNAILDAVFIAGFGWGLAGAALATGIGQCIGGLLPLLYFLRPNPSLLKLVPARLELKPILKTCANGSSEVMSSVSSFHSKYALQLPASPPYRRERSLCLRSPDVCAVYFHCYFHRIFHWERSDYQLPLRRKKPCGIKKYAAQKYDTNAWFRHLAVLPCYLAVLASGKDICRL